MAPTTSPQNDGRGSGLGAERIHSNRPNNVLTGGRVVRGDVENALAHAEIVVEDNYETGFVEHAYIEPEAGFARRMGDSIEIQACTQSPYMDRADIAKILGIPPESVRIIPTAVGGDSVRNWICLCSHSWPSRHGT